MATRGGSWVAVSIAVCAGCGQDGELIDGYFTPEVWAHIKTEHQLRPRLDPAPDPMREAAAYLGQRMFFDTSYSDAALPAADRKQVSCATCHDPATYFADDTASSAGTGYTRRNTISLINLVYRVDDGHPLLWDGRHTSLRDVVDVPIWSAGAMNSSDVALALAITAPAYIMDYTAAFGPAPPALPSQLPDPMMPLDPMQREAVDLVYGNAKTAFAEFETKIVTIERARFDRYLDGDDAFTDAEAHGLALFVGLCADCHRGTMFADQSFYNVGVTQRGEHAPAIDLGRAAVDPACTAPDKSTCATAGMFRTPSLRNVAVTGPYMHAGQIDSLADVLEFYNWGGHAAGFAGDKDPRVDDLEGVFAPEDLADLEAFLATLTSDVPCLLKTASGACPGS